jgi:hypothetical protein
MLRGPTSPRPQLRLREAASVVIDSDDEMLE